MAPLERFSISALSFKIMNVPQVFSLTDSLRIETPSGEYVVLQWGFCRARFVLYSLSVRKRKLRNVETVAAVLVSSLMNVSCLTNVSFLTSSFHL